MSQLDKYQTSEQSDGQLSHGQMVSRGNFIFAETF